MQGLFPCPFPNPVPGVSQSRSWRFPIPPRLSALTAAALPVLLSRPGRFPLRMGTDSAAARRVSPHGTPKPFSPAQAAAPWAGCERARGHRLLPCAGGGPTRHTQTRPAVRPCGAGQAPKTRPPSAGGRLLYVSCGSRQKALPPRDGVRRAPPLGPSSSSPLRGGGPAGRFRPPSGPNWNRFRVKIFVFAPAGLDGIPAKWYRMILVGGWRIAVHAAGRIHSPAAHAANPSFSTAPRNKYAPAGRHTRAAFAPQRNVRWEELHCRTFWICSPT